MSGQVQFLIAITIASVLILSVVFIWKGIYPRVIRVFLALLVIGQVVGYGLSVNLIKILIPRGETGTSYSVASTAIPLAPAFGIDWIRRSLERRDAQSRGVER